MDAVIVVLDALLLGAVLSLAYYFRQKGINLATKQDIGAITNVVENVKSSYAREIEKLRADLQLGAKQRGEFLQQQRAALFEFFEDSVLLLGDKLGRNPADMLGGFEALAAHESSVRGLLAKLYLDNIRLCLYLDPEIPHELQLMRTAGAVTGKAEEVRRFFGRKYGKLKIAIIKSIEALQDGREAARAAAAEVEEPAKVYREGMDLLAKSMGASFTDYESAFRKYLKQQGAGQIPEFEGPQP